MGTPDCLHTLYKKWSPWRDLQPFVIRFLIGIGISPGLKLNKFTRRFFVLRLKDFWLVEDDCFGNDFLMSLIFSNSKSFFWLRYRNSLSDNFKNKWVVITRSAFLLNEHAFVIKKKNWQKSQFFEIFHFVRYKVRLHYGQISIYKWKNCE